MGTEGKLAPKQRRNRSPTEPGAPGSEPRAKRGPGKAAATEPNTENSIMVGNGRQACVLVCRGSWTTARPPPPQVVPLMCRPARQARPRLPGRQCTSAGTARSGSGVPASWRRRTSVSTPGTPHLFIARSAPSSSGTRATPPGMSGDTPVRSRTHAPCAPCGSPKRAQLPGTSGPIPARSRTLAPCAPCGLPKRAPFPGTSEATRARSRTHAPCAQCSSVTFPGTTHTGETPYACSMCPTPHAHTHPSAIHSAPKQLALLGSHAQHRQGLSVSLTSNGPPFTTSPRSTYVRDIVYYVRLLYREGTPAVELKSTA